MSRNLVAGWIAALPDALQAQCSAFEPQFASWVLQRSGDPELARAALALALAQGAGHTGVAITAAGHWPELPGMPPLDPQALTCSSWVLQGTEHVDPAPRPFVLDGGRLYSWRSWQAECRVAAALRARFGGTAGSAQHASHGAALAAARRLLPMPGEPGAADPAADQRGVLVNGPGRALYTLTGGPGTGKTATVVKLLLLEVIAHGGGEAAESALRIALAAPTGKAAQRLAEAVLQGKQELRARVDLPPHWRAALQHIPEQAGTLHRLLGLKPVGALDPLDEPPPALPLDLLVVDEASMIDLELMDQLLAQLAPTTRLVLLGDPDQLSAVGAGSVLADLVAAACVDRSDAGHALGRLRHVWRAGGALVELAAALREGNADRARDCLRTGQPVLRWRELTQPAQLQAALRERVLGRWQPTFAALRDPQLAPEHALAQLNHHKLLCAVREGPFGVHAVNRWLSDWWSAQIGQRGERWFHGRLLMVTRNAPAVDLYNGDVGLCLRPGAGHDGPPRIWFGGPGGPRSLAPRELPEHEDAWALTVHKAQGSEYAEVLLLLPPDPAHPLLRRELLYTGATRARRQLEIWAGADALNAAIVQRGARASGLLARLAAVLPAPLTGD